MKCVSCGMTIKGKPIREQIGSEVHHYCCRACLEEKLCRRDKPLRKAFRPRPRGNGIASTTGRRFPTREA